MSDKFKCAHDELVSIDKLMMMQNPKNANIHSAEQIERLAKIIDFAGQRSPIVVSTRSGWITKGHGRLFAMQKLGWTHAAVDYQDYATEAAEYQDMIADNEIARWAALDHKKLEEDLHLIDLGDIDLLGLRNFSMDLPDVGFNPDVEQTNKNKVCPHCGETL